MKHAGPGKNTKIAVSQSAGIQNDRSRDFPKIGDMRMTITYEVPISRTKRCFRGVLTAVVSMD